MSLNCPKKFVHVVLNLFIVPVFLKINFPCFVLQKHISLLSVLRMLICFVIQTIYHLFIP